MKLTALICSRYRGLKDRHKITLAPITILIGKNGAGKSIICRLPSLLACAISKDTEGPLDLTAGGIEHASSFKDLPYAKGSMPFSLGAEFKTSTSIYRFETTLRYIGEQKSIAIEKFELSKNDKNLFFAELADYSEIENNVKKFNTHYLNETPIEINLTFDGIIPSTENLPKETRSELIDVFDKFRAALPIPSYLGPFRENTNHINKTPSQNIRTLGSRGERALELLADDKLRRGGELLAKTSEWYETHLGTTLTIDASQDIPRVSLVDSLSRVEVSLADTGAGFSQSIPVVVQHFAFQTKRLGSSILIAEQPELHLHPTAHGDIADLVISSVQNKEDTPAICIIETHSEQFIMRIRRRIAEGNYLNKDDVKILSLNHIEDTEFNSETPEGAPPTGTPVHVINFDESGNPDSWPIGVFEEALRDLTSMRRAARDRGL